MNEQSLDVKSQNLISFLNTTFISWFKPNLLLDLKPKGKNCGKSQQLKQILQEEPRKILHKQIQKNDHFQMIIH